MADLEQFTFKSKPVKYIGAFVELYNWKNYEQIYIIHAMIKFEKMRVSTTENSCNFGTY